MMELKSFQCKFYGNRLTVTTDGVELNSLAIPFSDIQEVIFYPIDDNYPSWGGYLKFVTEDNKALPVRVDGGFDMNGKQQNNGSLQSGNAFFFNCGVKELCAAINDEIMEIKELVQSKI